jgi:hydroxymethylbilane synthase
MSAIRRVRVGTRASPLALAQTEEVLNPLRLAYPHVQFDTVKITPDGDRRKSAPLLSMERGMFVKELEVVMLAGDVDVAVHSAKDMPAELPPGLRIAAFGARHDPRDVLIDRWGVPFAELPAGARLGTSSPRRAAQLRNLRPEVEIVPIRGNVGTRLDKALGDEYDGVVVAAAGVARLGRSDEISEYFPSSVCTPDAGQGALLVEARSSDDELNDLLSTVDDAPTRMTVTAERAFVAAIGGGCQVPVGVYAELEGETLKMSAMAGLPDGSRLHRVSVDGDPASPEEAGRVVARRLIDSGAGEILFGERDR